MASPHNRMSAFGAFPRLFCSVNCLTLNVRSLLTLSDLSPYHKFVPTACRLGIYFRESKAKEYSDARLFCADLCPTEVKATIEAATDCFAFEEPTNHSDAFYSRAERPGMIGPPSQNALRIRPSFSSNIESFFTPPSAI